MERTIRRSHRGALAAAAWMLAAAGAAPAADVLYVGPPGGDWNVDANWLNIGDGIVGNGDDTNAQPGAADAAIVLDGSTVNLISAENVLELQVSVPAHVGDTSAAHGVARLDIGSGAVLTTSGNSSGIRVGRGLDVGQSVGTSRGEIVQTAGEVYIAQGANGLRLSQADSGNVADSYYEISGGLIRGGAAPAGAIVSDLRLGAIGNVWGSAEFHVNGSGASAINFLDFQMAGSTAGTGTSIVHFSIDAGGVTPINAADELQFRSDGTGFGQNLLDIDLIGEAPSSDIRLINADRLNTNGIANDPLLERFTGMPEGTLIVRQFGGFEYTWSLDYNDGSDNGVLDAFVELDFVSKTVVPEPGGLALLTAVGFGLVRRRRA